MRDFLKLCARVERLSLLGDGEGTNDDHPRPMSSVMEEHHEQVGDHDETAGEDSWFCSEEQAVAVISESLDVFAGHLTTKVRRVDSRLKIPRILPRCSRTVPN